MIDEKYLNDARSIARQLETAAKQIRKRIDDRGLSQPSSLHNAIQTAVSTATDLEVTIVVYRRSLERKQ